jgi:thioredoxin reductase
MAGYFEGKVVAVIGGGDEAHRAVAMALAQAGADVAIAGQAADLSAEAALHSIANEVWAIGRRVVVTTIAGEDTAARLRASDGYGAAGAGGSRPHGPL